MRNIFELSKREQRVVIVIVTALIAIAFAKHHWEKRSQPLLIKSSSTPASSPKIHPDEDGDLPSSESSPRGRRSRERQVRHRIYCLLYNVGNVSVADKD